MAKENVIRSFVGNDAYYKGEDFPRFFVRYIGNVNEGELIHHHFRVASQHRTGFYDVIITVKDTKLLRKSCDCPQFDKAGTCKHVAASLINYYDDIIHDDYEISNDVLDLFLQENGDGSQERIKEQINLGLDFSFEDKKIYYKAKIGTKRLYALTKSKVDGFIKAYNNRENFEFGKTFTYEPDKHFFSKQDEKILDFLFSYNEGRSYGYYYYANNPLEMNDREFKSLLSLMNNKEFTINGYLDVLGVKEECPKIFKLSYDNDNYHVVLNNDTLILDNECKYIYDDKTLYLLPNNISRLLNVLKNKELKDLCFKEENMVKFKNGLLKEIKNNLIVEDSVKNFTIPKEKKTMVYFDIHEDHIVGMVKYNYDGVVIDRFDINNDIVRDIEFENQVVQDLARYNFELNDKEYILYDFDDVCDFLEGGIIEFSELYETFTSEKMQNTNILKKSRVETSFGIGKDGILNYEFKVGDVPSEEVSKILSSLKNKKKYYKLKSGDILKLDGNQELEELEKLNEDLELDAKMLSSGGVEIPKYRAFYLQTLKDEKYKNVKTNKLFDTFIKNFKKYQDADIKFSKQDEEMLRSYQKDGVKWLYTIYKCDFGGILADEMGLGKSFQTICFIKQVLKEKKDAKILVICPTSLVYNWKIEFDKYGENIKYLVLADNKNARHEALENSNNVNVFITSYGLVRNDFEEYEKKEFEVCVIDEAQTIKNYQADMTKCVKKIKAKTKIALSGTPLENSVLELWSIFDFIMPGYLNTLMKFREKYQVKDVDEKSLDILKNLNYQIKPFILRRLKRDVVKDLPDKIENIVYLDLPEVQKNLYKELVDDTKKRMDELIETKGYKSAQFEILALLLRLRQVCIDPTIIYDDYKSDNVKMDYLLDIVNSYVRDGHKILIFSTFKKAIEHVKRIFDDNSISNYVIDGSVKGKTRVQLVDAFNKDDTNCFLITLKAGGTGLNLTAADIVIHLDIWWNPQVENQATDRAHRIGQTKNVTVVKMVTKGTIEEKILDLQQKKKIVADNVMEGHSEQVLSKLSEKEMRDLLTMDMK